MNLKHINTILKAQVSKLVTIKYFFVYIIIINYKYYLNYK